MLGIINWQKKTHQMKSGRFSDLTDEQNTGSGSIGVALNMYTGWKNLFIQEENVYVILDFPTLDFCIHKIIRAVFFYYPFFLYLILKHPLVLPTCLPSAFKKF